MDQIALPEGTIYPRSIVEHDGATYFLCKLDADGTRRLGVIGPTDGDALRAFIAAHEDDYRAGLEQHFARHIRPFMT